MVLILAVMLAILATPGTEQVAWRTRKPGFATPNRPPAQFGIRFQATVKHGTLMLGIRRMIPTLITVRLAVTKLVNMLAPLTTLGTVRAAWLTKRPGIATPNRRRARIGTQFLIMIKPGTAMLGILRMIPTLTTARLAVTKLVNLFAPPTTPGKAPAVWRM